mmetsp:Transcript_23093/g.47175  ORF Transcript_23093/g.47175 Transcript_23093/m.47175 type:complete len:197 (+) Transcript_23093:13-603(+)
MSEAAAQASNQLRRSIAKKFAAHRSNAYIDLPKPFNIWKIVRGDKVQVISGSEKGKVATITRVDRKKQRVFCEGLNLVKKHVKGQGQQPGQIITKEAPIHVSNVALIDPVENVPTRVKMAFLQDGTKVRIAKKSGAIIPKPEILRQRRLPHPIGGPAKDTAPDVALAKTRTADEDALHDALRKLTLMGQRVGRYTP